MSGWTKRQQFLGSASDRTLASTVASVVGTSGGGSHIAYQLVHIGFGRVNLIDPDVSEAHHAHRLLGLTRQAVDQRIPKAAMLAAALRSVPSQSRVEPYVARWQDCHQVIRSSDFVFSCLDTYQAREELERYCRRFLIAMIDIGMDVALIDGAQQISGQVIASIPDGACMRCLGFIRDALLIEEANQYGIAGGRPQVIWPNGGLASTAIGLAMQMLLPWARTEWCPYYEYDGNALTIRPHPRLSAIDPFRCTHTWDVGDPLWTAGAVSNAQQGSPF